MTSRAIGPGILPVNPKPRLSGWSEKQFGDAFRVYEVQHPILDLEYLERWTRELDLRELRERLLSDASPD